MSKYISLLKSCHHGPGFRSPNRYDLDLSNEVLYALVGQEAAKISEVKVGDRKKNLPVQPDPAGTADSNLAELATFLIRPPSLVSDIFVAS